MNWIKKLFGAPKAGSPAQREAPSQKAVPSTEEELAARYRHLYRPALQLVAGRAWGFSRLGGLPQMPVELPWPEWKEKPLAFLAQLSLAELHASLPSFLPATGFLFFFYDQEQSVWGFDPNDVGAWRVLYAAQDCTGLAERSAPDGLEPDCIYKPTPVAPKRIELLPDSQNLSKPEFDWSRDGDAYSELRLAAFGDAHPHQTLGLPTPVQNDNMEEECQYASHGIYVGNPEGYKDPRVPALKPGAQDWKLLLQLDTDDSIGWMWGDVGMLYFWVREQDAKAADFSKVWMVFQCC
jgi:uncharacterized protein YwqG